MFVFGLGAVALTLWLAHRDASRDQDKRDNNEEEGEDDDHTDIYNWR